MRVYELAENLKIPSKEVLKIAEKLKMIKKYIVSTLTGTQEKKSERPREKREKRRR